MVHWWAPLGPSEREEDGSIVTLLSVRSTAGPSVPHAWLRWFSFPSAEPRGRSAPAGRRGASGRATHVSASPAPGAHGPAGARAPPSRPPARERWPPGRSWGSGRLQRPRVNFLRTHSTRYKDVPPKHLKVSVSLAEAEEILGAAEWTNWTTSRLGRFH